MSDEMYTVVWMDVKDQTLKRMVNGGIRMNGFDSVTCEFSKRIDISFCESLHAATCTNFSLEQLGKSVVHAL